MHVLMLDVNMNWGGGEIRGVKKTVQLMVAAVGFGEWKWKTGETIFER